MAQNILTVGSLNMDQVVELARLPMMGETVLGAGSLRLVPGGKGANQAVALARLGATVSMAGRVGRDPFGTQLLESLRADGVDTELVVVDEQEASGVAFIFLSPRGENAIVVASGANMRLGADEQQMRQISAALSQTQALVMQLEIPLETIKTLIVAGHRAGVPVVLNLAPAQALPLELLRQLEVLIVNETEASFLRDALAGAASTREPVRTVEEASLLAVKLHEQGIPRVVITLGQHGAVLAHAGASGTPECLHQEPPSVQVVDTTAAGDCFAGAFTVALTERQSPAQVLRFAVYASALKVTKFGAQSGLPARAEVDALLRSQISVSSSGS
ncbi:MAG TPA: ribokinase [Ktedonobacteraceae bacterium]